MYPDSWNGRHIIRFQAEYYLLKAIFYALILKGNYN